MPSKSFRNECIGLTGYEIKQGLQEGQMTIHLTFVNDGDCKTYSDFLKDFAEWLERKAVRQIPANVNPDHASPWVTLSAAAGHNQGL